MSVAAFGLGILSSLAAWGLSVGILRWLDIRYTFRRVQKHVDELATELGSDGFNPDYIVAIDRNSTIIGALLAGQLGLRTVVSVATENCRQPDGSRVTTVPEGYLGDLNAFVDKRILLFIAFNNSGTSLQVVYDYLIEKLGLQTEVRTAAFYSTPSPKLIPRYVAVRRTGQSQRSAIRLMNKMPWANRSWRRALNDERR